MIRNRKGKPKNNVRTEKEIRTSMINCILAYNKCFKEHIETFRAKHTTILLRWVHPIHRQDYIEELRKAQTV